MDQTGALLVWVLQQGKPSVAELYSNINAVCGKGAMQLQLDNMETFQFRCCTSRCKA